MAVQGITPEMYKPLMDVVEDFNGPLVSKLKEGTELTVEIAKDSGVPNFIKTSTNLMEQTDKMVKTFQDLARVCEQYAELARKIGVTTGVL